MKNLLVFFLLICINASATNFYVSTSAGGSNAGTLANPWTSISSLNSNMGSINAGDSVLFKRGDTFTGQLIVTRSGSAGNLIKFAAYGTGANPVLSGGTTLSSWTSLGGNLYEASLSAAPRVVTIGGSQYAPGRYPNTSFLTIEDFTSDNIITNSIISTLSASYVGGYAVIRNNRTVISRNVITAKSGDDITFTPTYSGVDVGFGFFLEGSPALDLDNEWWYNTGNNKLRVYSSSGTPASVIATSQQYLVTIGSHDYISFYGIDFKWCQEDMIELTDCNNVSITYCNFTYSGITALSIGGTTNHNITFSNNAISYINNDAAHIYGGDNDGMLIQNNTFTNIGSFEGQGANSFGAYSGVVLEGAACSNTEVSYNVLTNIGGMGLTGGGENVLIKNNYIENSLMYTDDIGAIYMQEGTATGKRITGNIINIVGQYADQSAPAGSDGQAMGIYSDGGNKYTEIDSNTITGVHYGNGIYMDDGQDINIHNNTVYGSTQGCAIDYLPSSIDITGLIFKKNVLFQRDATSYCFSPQNQGAGASISTWGTIDSNWYSRPEAQTTVIYSWDGSGAASSYTISGWSALYGFDTHSQGSPAWATSSNDTLMYNATNATVNVNTSRMYKDIFGNVYDGNVPLTPYRGILLFDIGAASGGLPNFIQRGRRIIN